MNHCIQRAKERYGLYLSEVDIIFIELMIELGLAKKQAPLKNKYGEEQKGRALYHLRYGGQLIAPIILESSGLIITFLPTGKRVSDKKFYKSRIDPNQVQKIKRLNWR